MNKDEDHDWFNVESNEDGTYMVPAEGWEDSITAEDLATAVMSYVNDQYNKKLLKVTDDPQTFQMDAGSYEFLLVTPDTLDYPEIGDVILSQDLLYKAQTLFSGDI